MKTNISLNSLKLTIQDMLQDRIDQGLRKACLIVETSAKENCPKDNGLLANSIQSSVEDGKGYVFSNLPYRIWTELGTGIFAETYEGQASGTGRQDPWHYFYTGKKLSKEELDYISKYGYQVFEGKKGIWRTTRGMHGAHYLYRALNDNINNIEDCFK